MRSLFSAGQRLDCPAADVLRLRPLTRAQADEVGIYLPLEGKQITSANFAPPPADKPGDATGVMTLFNAVRLSLRSGRRGTTLSSHAPPNADIMRVSEPSRTKC
jgi:hypothetical protein